MNADKDLPVDSHVLVSAMSVGQIIQSEDYGSIGGILKRHNPRRGETVLGHFEDVYQLTLDTLRPIFLRLYFFFLDWR